MTVERILERLERVRRSGDGWTAQCPGPNHKHGDRDPSLSVTQGDGKILLYCHAGCDVEQICAAIGWTLSDLFTVNGNGSNGHYTHEHDARKSAPKTSATAFEATEGTIDELQAGLVRSEQCQRYIESRGISLKTAGELRWGFTSSWPFHDSEDKIIHKPALAIPHYLDAKLVGIKFRTIDGTKLFSQMPGSSVDGLYGRGLLDPSRPDVLILEGPEDCALALTHSFNALAINSASAKASEQDTKKLRGFKRIFLVGDQDPAGQKVTLSRCGLSSAC
jgi:hypothetical protein